jgi:hypothetical protein
MVSLNGGADSMFNRIPVIYLIRINLNAVFINEQEGTATEE